MKTKIKRLCACGCGEVTNPGKKWIQGHHWKERSHSETSKRKISSALKGRALSKEHKKKLSVLAKNRSEEHQLSTKIAAIKYDPDYEYCDEWKDKEYKRDLRKDYCENADCSGEYNQLNNHHINLNKKNCRPFNVMTLCVPCHTGLHNILQQVNGHDILTINRLDKITYIHKRTRQVLSTIIRIQE